MNPAEIHFRNLYEELFSVAKQKQSQVVTLRRDLTQSSSQELQLQLELDDQLIQVKNDLKTLSRKDQITIAESKRVVRFLAKIKQMRNKSLSRQNEIKQGFKNLFILSNKRSAEVKTMRIALKNARQTNLQSRLSVYEKREDVLVSKYQTLLFSNREKDLQIELLQKKLALAKLMEDDLLQKARIAQLNKPIDNRKPFLISSKN